MLFLDKSGNRNAEKRKERKREREKFESWVNLSENVPFVELALSLVSFVKGSLVQRKREDNESLLSVVTVFLYSS